MLKQRIITAAILVPVFLWIAIFASPQYFAIATGLMTLLAALEWTKLMGLTLWQHRLIYLACFFSIGVIFTFKIQVPTTLLMALVWWLAASTLLIFYVRGIPIPNKNILFTGFMGVMTLIPCWVALNFLRAFMGVASMLYLFAIIWGADTVAYFAGRKWGKRKLAASISPGKTVAGAVAALIFSLVLSLIASYFSQLPLPLWPWIMLITFMAASFSILGDLFESMMKRIVGVKDSGNLLPGHGGVLDRIDSLTAAAPLYTLGLFMLMKALV